MKVEVVNVCGGSQFFELDPNHTIADLKLQIHNEDGVPLDVVKLYTVEGNLLSEDSISLSTLGDSTFALQYDLNGGGGNFECGNFVPYIKIFCCYVGCEGEWKKCQILCAKCSCTIM